MSLLFLAVCYLTAFQSGVVDSEAIERSNIETSLLLDRQPALGKEPPQRGPRDASEIIFSLYLNFISAEEFGGTCLAGRTAGLGGTTLRAEQRFPFGDANEWVVLPQRNISLDHGLLSVPRAALSALEGCVEYRLVQEEHGGGSCNCWSVTVLGQSAVKMNKTFVMCNTTASQRRTFSCIYCLDEESILGPNCTDTPEQDPPRDKLFNISSSCLETYPNLKVDFTIIFNGIDTGCDTVTNFNEGVEFAMRLDDDEVWIPLTVMYRDIGSSNGIPLGNLSNLIIRDYSVDLQNQIKINVSDLAHHVSLGLCDFKKGASSIQFRWLQTSRFGGVNQFRDLWGLDNLQITHIQEDGMVKEILADSFDSEQLDPTVWPLEGIRDANLSTICTVDHSDQALMFGFASHDVHVNGGQRVGPVVSRSIRTAPLPINLTEPEPIPTSQPPPEQNCTAEMFGGLKWPDTAFGSLASIKCPCVDSQADQAFRKCDGTGSSTAGAVWSNETDVSQCLAQKPRTITERLCQATLGLTASNSSRQVDVVSEVATITASNSSSLTPEDISLIASVVNQITDAAIDDPEIQKQYLEIIDNLQEVDRNTFGRSPAASQMILNSLATFSDALPINDSLIDGLTLGFDNYALNLQDIDFSSFRGQTLGVRLGSVEDALTSNGMVGDSLKITPAIVLKTNSTAAVQIPATILESTEECNLANGSRMRLSYSVFLSDILFQSPNQSRYGIGSIIVSVRIRCAANSTLSVPPRVFMHTTEQINNTNVQNGSCAMWEDRFGAWSTSGCREVKGNSGGQTVCECNQLGHFGILFDLSPRPLNPDAALALFVITYIGTIVSLLCLAILILTYLASSKLRRDTHAQVLLNMSVSLAGLYIFFMLGGHVTGIPVLCGFTAALLHYFLLVFFAWTAVEAVLLYIKLVIIIGTQSYESHYALKSGIPTWIIPGLIVTLSAGPGYQYYISEYYCRSTEWPFWFGFVLPFVVVYIFDWIMFVVILTSVIKRRNSNKKLSVEGLQDGGEGKFKSYRENLVIAFSLSVVFGLGWGFGLLATSSSVEGLTVALQVIFSIFVGAQGLLLFILHGVRNTDVRKVWKEWLASITACCSKETVEVQVTKIVITGTNSSSLNPQGNKEQVYLDGTLPKINYL